MLRKTQEKSNIGIFNGKEADYNKQILKTLLLNGKLTSWEIAKKICNNKYPNVSDFETTGRSHNIYSAIQRKTGRLPDLLNKEYIAAINGKWSLKFKGMSAVLILDKSLVNKIHPDYFDSESEFEPVKEEYLEFGPMKLKGKAVNNFLDKAVPGINNPHFCALIAQNVEKLIDEGIDLDRIKEEKLMMLALESLYENGFMKEAMKEFF